MADEIVPVQDTPAARKRKDEVFNPNPDARMSLHIERLDQAVADGRASDADDARRDIALLMAQGVEAPVDAVNVPAKPRGFYTQSTSYIVGERSLFASTQTRVITSYELDATAVTADANGDKIIYEGTVLTWTGAGVAGPHTTTTQAIGVLLERHNLRDSNVECGMVIGGWLNKTKLTDNGVFGTVTAQGALDLAAIGVFLTAADA